MAEMKKFDTSQQIYVDLSLTLATHGFEFLGTNDLGELSGICQECGHPIRYEQNFADVQTGDEYILGSDCMFKIYILTHWRDQIDEKDIEDAHLQRAGKWLWIIHRDNYIERINGDLPQPKDYNKDYKKLADDMKNLVMKIRREIKKELEAKERQERDQLRQATFDEIVKKSSEDMENYFKSLGVDLRKLNSWEMDFMSTMYKAYKRGWTLTEKQLSVLERIKNEKSFEAEETVVYSNNFETNPDKYIGKLTKTWIINKLAGVWVVGEIKSVEKETEKAILCDILIQNGTEKTLEDVWIPKSALQEEITL